MEELATNNRKPHWMRRAVAIVAAGSVAVPALAAETAADPIKRTIKRSYAAADTSNPSSNSVPGPVTWQMVGPKHLDRPLKKVPRHRMSFTGYEVSGYSSTFGPPTDPLGHTADGGLDNRPCFAIRDDSKLGHKFLVTIGKHQAIAKDCDWGPAASTGRDEDFTGELLYKMHLDPNNYDNGWARVRELHGDATRSRR